jgi:hypothetical protein
MSAYPDTRERRAGEARSHSDRDQRLRQMRGWSEMESDDGEMSGRSGSSGGLRTETHLCLSHSALQSLSGPHPTRTAKCHCRSVVCSGARSRPTSRSYPTSVNGPFEHESAVNGMMSAHNKRNIEQNLNTHRRTAHYEPPRQKNI